MPNYLVKLQKCSPQRMEVKIYQDDIPKFAYRFAHTSLNSLRTLAKQINVTIDVLTPAIEECNQDGESTIEIKEKQVGYEIHMRGIRSPAAGAKVFSDTDAIRLLKDVFDHRNMSQPEPVISWEDIDNLAVVDIDYHNIPMARRWDFDTIINIAANISPLPICYHASHGKGCKLYYTAHEGYTAAEIAAAGALSWLSADPKATAEIKTETRHPAYPRRSYENPDKAEGIPTAIYYPRQQELNLAEVARWYGREAKPEAIEAYLDERELVKGRHYPHEKCPIDPKEDTHGNPVLIGDSGIFCHRCSGKGVTYGTRRTPGFVPYSALVGGMDSEVYELATHGVHWEHAKYVLKYSFRMSDNILRLAYSCALKMLHQPDSPIVTGAFTAEKIARVGGKWVFTTDPGLTSVASSARNLYAKLPVTWQVWRGEMGTYSVKVDQSKVEAISHTKRTLDEYGYHDLQPIHGMQMWGRRLPYAAGVIPFPDSFLHLPPDSRPRYIPAAKRPAEVLENAWKRLESVFPGIDRRFVRFLLASRGVAESGGTNVFLAVAGPAGAGKSTTTAITAGLVGDKWTEPEYVKDSIRFRQGIIDGLGSGTYIVIDEIFKKATKERLTHRQALDPILTLTKKSKSHEMYVGPVGLPGNGVFVFTDIDVPQEVKDDVQLSRRIIYIKLSSRVDWRESMIRAGLDKPENFRLLSPEHNLAADVICSACADEFFSNIVNIETLADMCGVGFLERSNDFSDSSDLLKQFFNLLCDAPPLTEADAKRVSGDGYKRISNADATDLRDVWDQLADGLRAPEWKTSRRISEVDWSAKLSEWYADREIRKGVVVDIRHYKDSTIYARFRLGSYDRPSATNFEILDFRG